MQSAPNKPLSPKQRILALEKQLHDEKLKSARFEKIIEIMQNEHGNTAKKLQDLAS